MEMKTDEILSFLEEKKKEYVKSKKCEPDRLYLDKTFIEFEYKVLLGMQIYISFTLQEGQMIMANSEKMKEIGYFKGDD